MPKLLKLVEKTLHNVPFFVLMEITLPRLRGVRLRRNAITCAMILDILTDILCAVCFIAHYYAASKFDIG
jgi:hypothetical protein